MARPRHLNSAPIVEALVDFRVQMPAEFAPTSLAGLAESLSEDLPVFEELRVVESGTLIAGRQISQTIQDQGVYGYALRTQDADRIAQFRRDGFAFNKLKPYTTWQEVFSQAWDLWQLYVEKAAPVGVSRIDVYRLLDMDPRAGELRGIFTQLQEVKNRIFFGAITDRTAEMYE